MVLLFFHFDKPKSEASSIAHQIKQLDPIGFFFFAPSIISLILALQWGGSVEFPWSSLRIIGLFVTFAVLLIIFIAVEVRLPDTAMAPTRVTLNRSVAGGMLFLFLLSGGMLCIVYYLSVWFQVVQGQSAVQAGIRSLPLILGMMIMGILVAVFTQKVGYYTPGMLVSPILTSIGGGLLSTLQPSSGSGACIGYQALFGLGIGCGFQNASMPAQTVLPRADVPLGVCLMFLMQQLGGAVFLAVAQNLFANNLVDSLTGVAGLDPRVIINTGATDLRRIVPPNQLSAVVEACNYSLTRVFLLAAVLSAVMILGALMVEWKSIKKDKGTEGLEKGSVPKSEEGKGSQEDI